MNIYKKLFRCLFEILCEEDNKQIKPESNFKIYQIFQTSGLFKIDHKTGEIVTALPLTGKGRQVKSHTCTSLTPNPKLSHKN
jgi:hypothetical protein